MKRRSICISLMLVLLMTVLFSLSFAQQPIKIGVVNSQQVLQNSAEGKKAIARL